MKPGRSNPAPLVAAALALSAACLHDVPAGGAEDYEPKRCATAVEYTGPPLHAPLDTVPFSGLDGAMTGALDDSLVARLDAAVSWILANTKAPGMTAAVGIPGQGTWSASRGLARLEPLTPFAPRALFYWASAGKAFTAVVVSQLIEEGKLAYADPLARWFPDFPNAGAITVDHLLTHTSGAFSFNADLKFRRKKGYTAPDELIRIAARHGNATCPGERWSYSNTGYVLLARIVEKIEGLPFHDVVTRRVIDRLGLRGTVALALEQTPAGLATGHVAGKPDAEFDPSMPFGAGIIAAPADEMVRFWQAMLAGRVVGTPALHHAFKHLFPMYDPGTFYGRGVMVIEFKDDARPPNVWLGHGGGTPSANAVIAYDTALRVFIAVAINGDVSSEAAAYRLLKEVRAWRTSNQG